MDLVLISVVNECGTSRPGRPPEEILGVTVEEDLASIAKDGNRYRPFAKRPLVPREVGCMFAQLLKVNTKG